MPESRCGREAILEATAPETANEIRTLLGNEPDTAGRLMHTEFVSIQADQSISPAIDEMRAGAAMRARYSVQNVSAVDAGGRLAGVVPLRRLAQEVHVGLMNGPALGVRLGGVAWLWRGEVRLGAIVGLALAIHTIVAVSIGHTVPLAIKRFGWDPGPRPRPDPDPAHRRIRLHPEAQLRDRGVALSRSTRGLARRRRA